MKPRNTPPTSLRGDASVPWGTEGEISVPRRQRVFLCLAAALVLATPAAAQANPFGPDPYAPLRSDMVENQIKKRGIKDGSILDAMEGVPRHLFVPEAPPPEVYEDAPVKFAPGKTLPQAFLSAQMIELLELDGDEKVLEIGTGSGYDAAVLSRLAREVYTIEIERDLGEKAKRTLGELGYDNVHVRIGNGFEGLPEEAPFDAILLTAAPESIPPALFEQLKLGGRMVVAVGGEIVQDLQVITKTADGRETRRIKPVFIGPMYEPKE